MGGRLRLLVATVLLASISSTASAVTAYGSPELACRANFSGAYNLPNSAFFTNSTPALHATGGVAIKLEVLGATTQGIFVHDGNGPEVYEAAADAIISDVSLDGAGLVVFPQHFSSLDGIWGYQTSTNLGSRLTNLPLGASTWGRPHVDQTGRIGFRAGFPNGQALVSWDSGSTAIHATEVGIDNGSPYSFIFTPSTNGNREIAAKVRVGGVGQTGESQPDHIRIFASNGTSTLIASDRDADAGSPYLRFDNSVSLTDNGWVSFTAGLDGGARGVFFSNGTETRTIATTASPAVNEIESFASAANAAGLVVFRGRDGSGLRAIFAGDGSTLLRVIGEHDLVPTDLGTARIDQHDASPVFGGGPAVDSNGAIAFAAGLTPPDNNQIEWGSGLFVVHPLDTIFADGFESGDLAAWSAVFP